MLRFKFFFFLICCSILISFACLICSENRMQIDATVQLRCGAGNGTVFGTVQTNSNGAFSIMLDYSFFTLAQILSGCRAVVTTPPASCNATLASTGTLTSNLTSLGSTTAGPLPIINISANLFVRTM